jgi:hypothetical protein
VCVFVCVLFFFFPTSQLRPEPILGLTVVGEVFLMMGI